MTTAEKDACCDPQAAKRVAAEKRPRQGSLKATPPALPPPPSAASAFAAVPGGAACAMAAPISNAEPAATAPQTPPQPTRTRDARMLAVPHAPKVRRQSMPRVDNPSESAKAEVMTD